MTEGRPDNTDAYDTLGKLLSQRDQDRKQLEQLRDEANQAGVEYDKQLEEARQVGDQAAIEKLEQLAEQAQQAWIMAARALGEYDQPPDGGEDQPQPQEDDSATDQREAPGDSEGMSRDE